MVPAETNRWNSGGSESYSQHELSRVRENRELDRRGLRTSPFDVVSSMLLASILFTSAFVLLSFLIWLTRGNNEPVVSMPPVVYGSTGSKSSEGSESEFEKPLAAEIEAFQEPTLQDTIEQVSDNVSSVAVSSDTLAMDAPATDTATLDGGKAGSASRSPGPENDGPSIDGPDLVPRYLRWQLEFSASNIADYARQLDAFSIELVELGTARQFVSNLSTLPKVRLATSEAPRIYFVFTSSSPLQQFETQLLRKAGIDATGNEIAKFISGELETRLAQIEFEYAQTNGGHDVTEIVKTVFESKRTGKVYDFRVIEQRYRDVYAPARGE